MQRVLERCGVACASPISADLLNHHCFCLAIDPAEVRANLNRILEAQGSVGRLTEAHANLFSALPVFVLCLPELSFAFDGVAAEARAAAVLIEEWRAQSMLDHNAIIDEAPEQQFLYAEFVLFQRLLEAQGCQSRGALA
jgi:hypothetical protein